MADLDFEVALGDEFDGKDCRGWAMRHGRCRRLRADKGREGHRGRAVFSRSVNRSRMTHSSKIARDCFVESKSLRRRRVMLEALCAEGDADTVMAAGRCQCDDVELRVSYYSCVEQDDCCYSDLYTEASDCAGDVGEPDACHHASVPEGSLMRLQRRNSEPITQFERLVAIKHAAAAVVPLEAWVKLLRETREQVREHVEEGEAPPPSLARHAIKPEPRAPSRWDEAVAVALRTARAFIKSLPAPPAVVRKACKVAPEDKSAFADIQREFLAVHGAKIEHSLRGVFGSSVKLRPAPLAPEVKARFAEAVLRKSQEAVIRPAFHGTSAFNHSSIFARGLLIPGVGNTVQVSHGLSHGRGIYVAMEHSAWLAKGFCTEPRMLVCAVVDDAVPVATPYQVGNFMVTRESSSVRQVGDALVVFDPARVAPLFEAVADLAVMPRCAVAAPSPPQSQTWAPAPLVCAARDEIDAAGPARPRPGRRGRCGLPASGLARHYARRAAERRRA